MSKITESARGEYCSIRIPGVCRHRDAVWAHANGSAAGKGIGQKAHDILGAYACQACHDIYDRRRSKNDQGELVARIYVELCFWEGHARSVLILVQKELLVMDRRKAKVAA